MVDVAPSLATLPNRPPTPPKENHAESFAKPASDASYLHERAHQVPLDTPEDSPSSSTEYFASSVFKSSKRVGFSPWNEYHKSLSSGSKIAGSDIQIRPLPPSKECKSSKSILKSSVSRSDTLELSSADDNFPAMLESVVQQLVNPARSSRLDAYQVLLGCLAAYNDLPDSQAVVERMTLLTEFIRRDMNSEIADNGLLDTQLVTQALKLLTAFVWTPKLAESLPDDFCSYILERSISCLEDHSTPKTLVNHYMHLLARQDFPVHLMSSDRVNRLLAALDEVTTHVKGNGIAGQRLMIYQRLLTQAKSQMASRAKDWIDHLFSGMLSSIKEIRSRAIAFGIEAGLLLGTISSVSQNCVAMFNRESPDGTKFLERITIRLIGMLASKDDGVHVPQIWSVVILFLRCRRRQIERWEHLKSWIVLIQRCFNSSDPHVKFQANLAWNKLVFSVSLDTSTGYSMTKMLRQPLVTQMERKANDKPSRSAKQIAQSSYCTLLYYAFRPGVTHAQLDQYWDQYVSQILPGSFVINKADANYACQILAALFGDTHSKAWDENRANVSGPVRANELPRLDPKWVRLRVASILKVFERFFESASWDMIEDNEADLVHAWRNFAKALGDAGSKEVKVSVEAMTAIARVLDTIKTFWERTSLRQASDGQPDLSIPLKRFGILINLAVAGIGNIPFIEKRFIKTSHDSFEVSETPSNRSIRYHGGLNCPAMHLLGLLITTVEDSQVTDIYSGTIKDLMQIALYSAKSRQSQLKVLRDLIHLLLPEEPIRSQARVVLWRLIAEATSLALKSSNSPENISDSPQCVGRELREVVKTLEIGILQRSDNMIPTWQTLKANVFRDVQQEIGDGGVVIAVIEPLAAYLRQDNTTSDEIILRYATSLLDYIPWPTRQTMEQARKSLWGASLTSSKHAPTDPYDNLYGMIVHVLRTSYSCSTPNVSNTLIDFFSAVTLFISSCPPSFQNVLLKRIQQGLNCWIEDPDKMLNTDLSESQAVYQAVLKVWAAIRDAIDHSPKTDSTLLQSIETLIVSSLRSRHKGILNESIELWNRTFGNAESLEYPDALRKVMLKLRLVAELKLPGFLAEMDEEVASSPFDFIESPEGDEMIQQIPIASVNHTEDFTTLKAMSPPLIGVQQPSNVLTNLSGPPPRRRGLKTTPTRRLRHLDSQIQFAAIESSPIEFEGVESQLLTDRQKEVQERQRHEAAAIFPDLKSSPRLILRDVEVSPAMLITSINRGAPKAFDPDSESSPIFPSIDISMNDFLGSSPTPKSSKKGSVGHSSDQDPRSSPHSVSSFARLPEQANPPLSPSEAAQNRAGRGDDTVNIRSPGKRADTPVKLAPVSTLDIDERTANMLVQNSQDFQMETPHPDLGKSKAEYPHSPDVNLFSDCDVFVDASSDPILSSPANTNHVSDSKHNKGQVSLEPQTESRSEGFNPIVASEEGSDPHTLSNAPTAANSGPLSTLQGDVSRIMDSFEKEEGEEIPCLSTNEDDQISAQLVSDLERASSQVERGPYERSLARGRLSKITRKRGNNLGNLSAKKARSRSLPKTLQVVIESRPQGSLDKEPDDIVLLETRSVANGEIHRRQEVQKEQSLPLSGSEFTQAPVTTPEFRKIPARVPRTSTGSPVAYQEPSRTSKKRRASHGMITESETGAGMPSPGKRRRSTRLSQASTHNSCAQYPVTMGDKVSDGHAPFMAARDMISTGDENTTDRTNRLESTSKIVKPAIEKSIDHKMSPRGHVNQNQTPAEPPKPRKDTIVLGKEDETSTSEVDPTHTPFTSEQRRQSGIENEEDLRTISAISFPNSERGHTPGGIAPAVASFPFGRCCDPKPLFNDSRNSDHAAQPTGKSIVEKFRSLLSDIQQIGLEAEEEREIVGVLFQTVGAVHEAGRRGNCKKSC